MIRSPQRSSRPPLLITIERLTHYQSYPVTRRESYGNSSAIPRLQTTDDRASESGIAVVEVEFLDPGVAIEHLVPLTLQLETAWRVRDPATVVVATIDP